MSSFIVYIIEYTSSAVDDPGGASDNGSGGHISESNGGSAVALPARLLPGNSVLSDSRAGAGSRVLCDVTSPATGSAVETVSSHTELRCIWSDGRRESCMLWFEITVH